MGKKPGRMMICQKRAPLTSFAHEVRVALVTGVTRTFTILLHLPGLLARDGAGHLECSAMKHEAGREGRRGVRGEHGRQGEGVLGSELERVSVGECNLERSASQAVGKS